MATLTRGPLPARVYWRRRLMVLATAVLLVTGLARVLVGGGDAPAGDADLAAVPAAGTPAETAAPSPDATPTETKAHRGHDDDKRKKKKRKKQEPEEPVLAQPEGDCLDRDVAVTPAVDGAVAGRTVVIVLELRTALSPACTWRVSPESLTVKVTSGADDIWTSRQCERAIPTRDVVVRRDVSTEVAIRWSGRRSDAECTRFTDWALPGWYHVAAAALAGEPSDLQFELTKPQREVIVKEPKGSKKDKHQGKTKPRDKHVSGPDRG